MRIRNIRQLLPVIGALVVVFASVGTVQAASNSTFNQTINGGTLATDILDAGRNPVASPSAAMAAANFSFDCQTVTGTLGTTSQRLYVTNPSGTANGWTLSLGATGGGTAVWTDGGTNDYAFNDAAGSGCTNGQLTVNPTVATVNDDCVSTACTGATVTKGSSTVMTGGTDVDLMSGDSSANVYRGYLTGISLSQKIPAEQPAASYSINMTLTVAAD